MFADLCREGFIEANRDLLDYKLTDLLEKDSTFDALKRLAEEFRKEMHEAGSSAARPRQKTVGQVFAAGIKNLVDTLKHGETYYVRCVKPNHRRMPAEWDEKVVLEQLQYSGTLEVTEVRKAGFNLRWPLDTFCQHYRPLAGARAEDSEFTGLPLKDQARELLQSHLQVDEESWRVGSSVVFLKGHHVLRDADARLEDPRFGA